MPHNKHYTPYTGESCSAALGIVPFVFRICMLLSFFLRFSDVCVTSTATVKPRRCDDMILPLKSFFLFYLFIFVCNILIINEKLLRVHPTLLLFLTVHSCAHLLSKLVPAGPVPTVLEGTSYPWVTEEFR